MIKQPFKYLPLLLLVLTSTHIYGQVVSIDGNFQVDFNKGCAPFTVEITSNVACPCNLYWDGGSGIPVDGIIPPTTSHTYTDPGIYDLVLIGTGLDRDHIEIIVFENIQPEFTASSCSGLEVDVDITDTNYDSYTIDYGDGSPIGSGVRGNNSYTYAVSGTYFITVSGFYTGAKPNCNPNTSSVEIVNVLPNAMITGISLTSTTEATLDFTTSPNVQYYLQIQANDDDITKFQTYMPNISHTSPLSISDTNLDFDANYYCFRLATFDPCDNAFISYSNILCSVDLDEIVISNLSNRLEINASATGLTEHRIQLLNFNTGVYNQVFTTTNDFYNDGAVICNIEYCYRVVSDYNGILSTSLTRCGTALSLNTPTTIADISIDATSTPILTWEAPTSFVATVYTIADAISKIGESTIPSYTDIANNSSTTQVCYQIGYIDECDNTADDSEVVCSIFLTDRISSSITTLQWTPYTGWSTGVAEYQLIRNGDLSSPIYQGLDVGFTLSNTQDVQITEYQIIAIPNNGLLSDSKSNIVRIANRSNITFPNAFVANGVNNEFKVVGRYIATFDLKIYTRWGELIAYITNPNTGWDGTQNGQDLPEGNYIYSAEIVDDAGNIHRKNGAVLLIRK